MYGKLAAKYEACSDPGRVSTGEGDLGGKSYGAIQFSSSAGSVEAFVDWLRASSDSTRRGMGEALIAGYPVNSEEFIAEWHALGSNELAQSFLEAQMEYGMELYYQPSVDRLRQVLGFDAYGHSEALQEVIYARSVQYSFFWIADLFRDAATKAGVPLYSLDDAALITAIYQVLIDDGEAAAQGPDGLWHSPEDWVNGSEDVVYGLLNRFRHERDDALTLLSGGTIE